MDIVLFYNYHNPILARIGRRKDGRYYPKDPRRPRKPSRVYFPPDDDSDSEDEWKIQERVKFAQDVAKRFTQHKEELQSIMGLGTTIILNADPNLLTLYATYRVGKYGYCLISRIYEENKRTNDLSQAFANVVEEDIREIIASYLNQKAFKNAAKIVVDRLWESVIDTRDDTERKLHLEKIAKETLVDVLTYYMGKMIA